MDQPGPVKYPGARSGRGLGDVAGGEGAWVAQGEWSPAGGAPAAGYIRFVNPPVPAMYPGFEARRGLHADVGGEGARVAEAEWSPSWRRLAGGVSGWDFPAMRFEASRTKLVVGAAQSGSS